MKKIDIDYVIYSLMNSIHSKYIKIRVILYTDDFYNIDRFVVRIKDKIVQGKK